MKLTIQYKSNLKFKNINLTLDIQFQFNNVNYELSQNAEVAYTFGREISYDVLRNPNRVYVQRPSV